MSSCAATFPFLFAIGLSSASNGYFRCFLSANMLSNYLFCTAGCSFCLYSPWSFWSLCSASCGRGVRFRVRSLAVLSPECAQCSQTETERQYCDGKDADCRGDGCRLGSWSDWTNCSVDCGMGWKLRHRKLINSSLLTHCNTTRMTRMTDVGVCVGVARRCAGISCQNATWSDWEKCSVSSGRGMQMRRRGKPSDSSLIPGCYEVRSCDVPSQNESAVSPSIESRTCSLSWTQWSVCSSQLRVRITSECLVHNETRLCWTPPTEPAGGRMSKKPSERR